MDNNNEEGRELPILLFSKGELKGAIPFMINYSHEPNGSWAPHKYQYYRANSIDNYAGYWTTTKNTFCFRWSVAYALYFPQRLFGGPMDNRFFTRYTMPFTTLPILTKPEWRAVALIIKHKQGHEIVDFYGAAPFSDWRNLKRTPPLT